ncbi:MAG TPA: hypothetical protein ENK18_09420, partial [Deltaproteobacteria bacterium]|nr:hypothetical protein [Deltaproteobacteria bacterium]
MIGIGLGLVLSCGPARRGLGDLPDLQIVESQLVSSTVALTWTTGAEGRSWVEYGVDDPAEHHTPHTAPATAHEVRLVGLEPLSRYRWRAITELDDGTRLQTGINTLERPPPPQGLPRLTTSVHDPRSVASSGYLVTTLIEADGGWVVILDGDGDAVWWYDTGHDGTIPPDLVGLTPPGWGGHTLPVTSRYDAATHSILVAFYDGAQQLDVATFRRIPLDAMSPDEIVTTRTELGHHDFVYHADEGVVAWLAYQVERIEGERWAADAVLETLEGNRSAGGVSAVWSWHDDFEADPILSDELQRSFSPDIAELEWTHSNSLMYEPISGSYFVMSKFLDCLVKIDRATGRGVWVLGGAFSDFTLPSGDPVWSGLRDSALWSHAHMSELWYDPAQGAGGFVVFDNGYHHPSAEGGEGASRISEYRFDEQAGTVEKIWEYAEPDGAFTPLMGDVRRLPGS